MKDYIEKRAVEIAYYREQCDSKTDSKSIWYQQINGTYGCNIIERFVWVIQ